MLGRQIVGARLGVERDEAARQHGAEPLAHLALVETRALGDARAAAYTKLVHHREETRRLADARHQRERATVQDLGDALREARGPVLVERSLAHGIPPRRAAPGARFARRIGAECRCCGSAGRRLPLGRARRARVAVRPGRCGESRARGAPSMRSTHRRWALQDSNLGPSGYEFVGSR
ncbi:MAG: hypothetical protein OEM49_10040, partial [Myxococcales bacterium]|nr:hypothetical protein [Myxococcales bacterium]